MLETRTEPAFGALRVDESKTTSLRRQLMGWCKLIAPYATRASERGVASEVLDDFLLSALEATSELSALEVGALAKLILRGDYVLQLAKYLAEEDATEEVRVDLENQVQSAVAALEEPDESTTESMIAQSAGYLPEALISRLGATRYGLEETLFAALIGAASNARRAAAHSREAWESRKYEALGMIDSLSRLKPKERKERRKEVEEQAERIESETRSWQEKQRSTIDGIARALATLADPDATDATLFELAKTIGSLASDALEILELATRSRYGTPTPIGATTSAKVGKCIAFMGDDFDALDELLKEADYNDLNVWTRGEAIAAHAFPHFRAQKRLVGHYGGSWRDQRKELGAFPGSIVVSGAPVEEPDDSYAPYMYSCEPTRWSGISVVARKENGTYDFSGAIRGAKDSPGMYRNAPTEKIPVGFFGESFDGLVEKTARAFRENRLKRVAIIVGQDFPNEEQDYFTRLFEALPDGDCALAAGDAKFRFNRISGQPTSFGVAKCVDFGRERDAYATLRFADALGAELERSPDNSPISFFASLYGETSLAYALAVVARGYEVVVGPCKPACWNDELVEAFRAKLGIKLASDPVADLAK